MTLQEHIRFAISKLRTSSMPLSDLIPLLQEAADELDRRRDAMRLALVSLHELVPDPDCGFGPAYANMSQRKDDAIQGLMNQLEKR